MTEPTIEEIINRQLAIMKMVLHKTMALVPDIDKELQLEIYRQVNLDLRVVLRKKRTLEKNQRELF